MQERHELKAGAGAPVLTTIEKGRLGRWRSHLDRRGVTLPEVGDFLAFGRLSTLERLRPVIAWTAPDLAGPLRLAIRALKREKLGRRIVTPAPRPRGPKPRLSVAPEDLPEAWRQRLAELAAAPADATAGRGRFVRRPLNAARLGSLEYLLRVIAWQQIEAGAPVELTAEGVRRWFAAARERGLSLAGLSAQLGLLARFAEAVDPALARLLRAERASFAPIVAQKRKRKDAFIARTGLSLGQAWLRAEELLAASIAAPRAGRRATTLALHAAAIALAIVAPLRIGDLHRLRIGETILRDATGWRIEIDTQKTISPYARDLWPEIEPFLDRLVTLDAPGAGLWRGYDDRVGTWLFSCDGGATGLSGDWISDVWGDQFGCGAHIVRTLWHDLGLTAEDDMTHVALNLCGQSSPRTARHYQTARAGRELCCRGQGLLRRARAETMNVTDTATI